MMIKKGLTRLKSLLVVVIAISVTLTFALDSMATEGGGGSYLNGAEDFMVGALPPPGTYIKNYLAYLRGHEFKNNKGDDSIPGFKMDGFVEAFRLFHVRDETILGATWTMQIAINIQHLDLDTDIPGLRDDQTGFGDVLVNPMILTWHFKNWHLTLCPVDIMVPVGDYDSRRAVNPGRNYWNFEPALGITYLSDYGIEVSTKIMYAFNTKNQDTEYLSGQEFHVDYAAGYHYKNWILGVAGYYYQQVTDDELNGKDVDNFKGRAIAVGPAVVYNYKNMNFILKWMKDFNVENKPETDRIFFNLTYSF